MLKKITDEYLQELNIKTLNAMKSPKYDHYFLYDYNKKYYNQDFTDVIEYISVNSANRIIGHFYFLYDKESKVARDGGVIRFTESLSDTMIFGIDIKELYRLYFEKHDVAKFDSTCCVCNPLFETYKRIANSKNNFLGIALIGPLKNHVLINGKYEDAYIVEVTKESYFKNKTKKLGKSKKKNKKQRLTLSAF